MRREEVEGVRGLQGRGRGGKAAGAETRFLRFNIENSEGVCRAVDVKLRSEGSSC